jgi:hypothetical protein
MNISESIEREASRLSQNPAKPTRQDAAWARVQSLKSGTDILLSTRTHPGGRRYFISAAAVERPSKGSISAGAAAVVGAPIAGVAGATLVAASGGSNDVSPGGVGVAIFAPIGAGVGFLAGSLAESNSKRPVVIYRN